MSKDVVDLLIETVARIELKFDDMREEVRKNHSAVCKALDDHERRLVDQEDAKEKSLKMADLKASLTTKLISIAGWIVGGLFILYKILQYTKIIK